MLLTWTWWLGCSNLMHETVYASDTITTQENIALDRHPSLIQEVRLPDSQYQEEDVIPITSNWRLVGMQHDYRIWETALPIRSRSLFFTSAPSGMKLVRKQSPEAEWNTDKGLRFNKRMPKSANTWNMSSHSLRVHRSISDGPPDSWEYAVHYPKAEQRERILADTNTSDPKSYVIRQQQIGDDTRHGLYLPAPSSIQFQVTVPQNGVFRSDLVIIPPEAADPAEQSNGAKINIFLQDATGKTHQLLSQSALIGEYTPIEASLNQWAGQVVSLSLQSTAEGSPSYDYVFLADPVIVTPTDTPKRVVWIFIDTLRKDHLSMYGYERETTPKLDAWAKQHAGIYTQGRSIAPWTLPSARTMVTGSVPEKWGSARTLQAQLSEQGWYTTMLVGNIYLSSNFELQKDWTSHRCINWPLAEVQIDRARDVLAKQHDRNVFMMLHFMDMHLPYTEPLSYRSMYAGERPSVFKSDSFGRSEILKNERKLGESGKQYIIDRYDNNMTYIDDVLTPFLEEMPEDTIVAIFSDHGEEFWDHGSFEHGHTLYDELLNVPYILKMPGIDTGVHHEPVSLLDLAPTTAHALQIDIDQTQGWALQEHSSEEIRSRPQAFGRLLYGHDAWGSLKEDIKYASMSGEEEMFDLAKDPEEQQPIAQTNAPHGRKALSDGLNRDVRLGFRLTLSQPRSAKKEVTAIVRIPTGVAKAWRASDPTKRTPMTVDYTEDTAVFTWDAKNRGGREAFIMPNIDALEALQDIQVSIMVGDEERDLNSLHIEYPEYAGDFTKLQRGRLAQQTLTLSYAMLPIPSDEDLELDAFDDEVSEELKVLGYME